MENDQKVCAQCGKEFTSVKDNTKFCSEACRKAYARQAAKVVNLTWDGKVIRGQHEGDVAPTGSGIIHAFCRACGKEYYRWLDSKLARLVRNEMEGSIHWGSGEEFRKRGKEFDGLMAIRVEEAKFCSEECQTRGTRPLVIPPAKEFLAEEEEKAKKPEEIAPRASGVGYVPPKRRGKVDGSQG